MSKAFAVRKAEREIPTAPTSCKKTLLPNKPKSMRYFSSTMLRKKISTLNNLPELAGIKKSAAEKIASTRPLPICKSVKLGFCHLTFGTARAVGLMRFFAGLHGIGLTARTRAGYFAVTFIYRFHDREILFMSDYKGVKQVRLHRDLNLKSI